MNALQRVCRRESGEGERRLELNMPTLAFEFSRNADTNRRVDPSK